MEELANEQQIRFLISLHTQTGVPYDAAELATLTKWQAAERINALRGRPEVSADALDEALKAVAAERVKALGLSEPSPQEVTPDSRKTRA